MTRADYHFLVVGSGSIAKRHIRNIRALHPQSRIDCVSASGRPLRPEEIEADDVPASLDSAVQAHKYTAAVIASPAPYHLEHAEKALSAGIPTLIEKPLAQSVAQLKDYEKFLETEKGRIGVGYNLRYLPSAKHTKKYLESGALGDVISVSVDVGQYLPDWRPDSDYRKGVSAKKSLGGGVLLELSHELDYLIWLFGDFTKVFGSCRQSGTLEIDVEDSVDAILFQRDVLQVSLHMDFLQRAPHRVCKVVGTEGTLIWNLIENSVSLATPAGELHSLYADRHFDRNLMYLEEFEEYLSALTAGSKPPISFDQGRSVIELVDAIRESSESGRVVGLEGR